MFWTASSLALRGDLATIFDPEALALAMQVAIPSDAGVVPWLYPPIFLLFLLPFALVPYIPSLLLWFAVPLRLLVGLLRRQLPRQVSPWLLLCFPGIAQCMVYGQNGLLSTLILGAGLSQLDRRPLLAGTILGLLSYKPQLCLLYIPILLVGGYWRSMLAMAASVAALMTLATLAFGFESWQLFYDNRALAADLLENGEALWPLMVTVYGAARLAGADGSAAMILQIAIGGLSLIAVCILWRSRAALPLKASGAVTAALLATPYAMNYDLATLILPIAWITADLARRDWLRGEKLLLGVIWTLPLWGFLLAAKVGVLPTPVILLLLLVAILRRASAPATEPQSARAAEQA
jgi:hypothetical protein